MKILLLVSDPYIATQLLICLRGFLPNTTIVDYTGANCLRFSRRCRSYQQSPAPDIQAPGPEAAAVIDGWTQQHGCDIALAAGMDATFFLSRAAPYVKRARIFPVADESVLKRLNNKWEFAKLCTQLGVPHPRTVIAPDHGENLPPWCVDRAFFLKPLSLSGGRGVSKFESPDQLTSHASAIDGFEFTRHILQEGIPGSDGVLGVLADKGQIIAATVHVYGHEQRTARFYDMPRVVAMGGKIVKHLELSGIVEFDLRTDERDGAWYLIECNPRIWASVALSAFAGVNFVRLGLALAMGSPRQGKTLGVSGGEWMRLKELAQQVRANGLLAARGRAMTWNGLRLKWSDPIPSMFIRRGGNPAGLQ